MKRNLIKTDNYLLVFDKLSEIKEGDWYKTPLGIYSQFNGTEKLPIGTRRVASHAPLNGAPYLDGVDVLPPNWPAGGDKREYKEEDIRKAFCDGQFDGMMGVMNNCPVSNVDTYIQSLQQPKLPIAFECEDEYVHDDNVPYPKTIGTQPKTITNSEGRTEWVGKYIYE